MEINLSEFSPVEPVHPKCRNFAGGQTGPGLSETMPIEIPSLDAVWLKLEDGEGGNWESNYLPRQLRLELDRSEQDMMLDVLIDGYTRKEIDLCLALLPPWKAEYVRKLMQFDQ